MGAEASFGVSMKTSNAIGWLGLLKARVGKRRKRSFVLIFFTSDSTCGIVGLLNMGIALCSTNNKLCNTLSFMLMLARVLVRFSGRSAGDDAGDGGT